MKKLILTLLILSSTLKALSQIGPVSTPSPLSSMVQNPTLGITTWRTILPNPIVEVIVAKGTESYTHNAHLFIYPNYALPRADANAERVMFIDSLGNVKVSVKFPFDNRYLKSYTETDPLFIGSPSYGITGTNISNWNTSFSWGNHSGLYPLLSGSYSNPSWINSLPYSKITGVPSFLTSESDPIYSASSWFSTTNNSTNWNTAFGWGSHSGLYPTYNGTGATGTWGINVTGNSGTVTNGVYSNGSYTNPSWILSLPWSKITSTPTSLSGYGITDAYPLTGNPSGFLTTEVDGSVTNELQSLSLSAQDSLSISAGNKLKLPYIKTEIDGSITNEIQTLSKVGNQVTLSNSGGNFSVADADSSTINEIQTISRVGSTVTLSNSGGSFSIDDADNSPTNEIELPSMTGQSGKVLGTNGSAAVWQNASSGTVTSVIAGTGLSGGTITSTGTISMPNTGTSGTYSSVTTDAQGRVTAGTNRVFTNNVSRSIVSVNNVANGFQASATRDVIANYSVTILSTVSLSGNATGYAVIEICPTNSATAGDWQEVGRTPSGQSGTLVIGLTLTQTGGGQIGCVIPAGYYARIRSVNTAGTPTYTYNSGQEVQM